MIDVLTDVIQGFAILAWAAITFFLIRRANRHELRLDAQQVAKELREAHATQWEEPKAMCGCGHHQCFHDENGCAKTEVWAKYDSERYFQPCGCKRYTGPEPLPTVIP